MYSAVFHTFYNPGRCKETKQSNTFSFFNLLGGSKYFTPFFLLAFPTYWIRVVLIYVFKLKTRGIKKKKKTKRNEFQKKNDNKNKLKQDKSRQKRT